MQVLLTTCGSWHLRRTARAFQERGALAGLWISDKNSTGLPPGKYHRCWPFHLAMKPFYRLTPWWCWVEKPFYALFPLWRGWLKRQSLPKCDAVHAIMGFATEPFDWADRHGALKVVDASNSHPTTYYGYMQRECDIWCPGENVPNPRWMFARMNRELERADLVLCPSNFVKDTMLANGVPEDKCFVSPFGVDTSTFVPRKSMPPKPRFISVGMVCLRKGHQYLFRAFELVKRAIPDAELICVGNYRPDFRLERPRWEGTFTHHPSLPHQELARLLTGCTAFVLPSQEEGFALVILEAMAAGLPVVTSYESGATTLVKDGIEGFVIRPREPRQIADAMIRLAQDRALNQRMGEAARRKGAEGNTWQDYGDRLLAEYKRRIEGKRAEIKTGETARDSR
ncbi:MAG: glycosyltransferase family 4 protein [Verrucomicrobiia bacterium]